MALPVSAAGARPRRSCEFPVMRDREPLRVYGPSISLACRQRTCRYPGHSKLFVNIGPLPCRFRRLWFRYAVSAIGTQLSVVAIAYEVYKITEVVA